MSISLTAVQQTDFDELVKAEYRSTGFLLRDAVRTKSDVIGSSVEFRKVDQVISVPTAYLAAVSIQDQITLKYLVLFKSILLLPL